METKLIKPQPINPNKTNSWERFRYYKTDIDNFYNNVKYIDVDLDKDETLYIQSGSISQDKLRNTGFKITRSKEKADVVVIEKPFLVQQHWRSRAANVEGIFIKDEEALAEIDMLIADEPLSYEYIETKDLYKYIYKYEGNQEMFKSCNELFKSHQDSNTKMAMEFMSNANWEGNKIYLVELFNLYGSSFLRDPYKNSISFKGFLTSLDFEYKNIGLYKGNQYSKYCENEEHHQWVHDKYSEEFKRDVYQLAKTAKINIDEFKFSIDKSITKEDEQGD